MCIYVLNLHTLGKGEYDWCALLSLKSKARDRRSCMVALQLNHTAYDPLLHVGAEAGGLHWPLQGVDYYCQAVS